MPISRSAPIVAVLLAGCGVVVTPDAPTGARQGEVKTVNARIQVGSNTVSAREVTVAAIGAPQTANPVNAGGDRWRFTVPGSAAWPAGTNVTVTWRVDYNFLGVSSQTNTAVQTFTVAPPPALVLPNSVRCMRQGETVVVPVSIESGTATAALVVTPASLATPSPASVPVSTAANSFNLTGVQLGTGTLTASAPGTTSDSVNVRVIEQAPAPVLTAPANGAAGVFAGSTAPTGSPATVSYSLDWQDTPGASEYRVHFTTESGAETFTNSTASDILLAAPPGTEVRWKIQGRFDDCPSGSTFGPESEERTFSVWEPEE